MSQTRDEGRRQERASGRADEERGEEPRQGREAQRAQQRAGAVALGRISGEVVEEEDFAVREVSHERIDRYRTRLRDWATRGMSAGKDGLLTFQQVLLARELRSKMRSVEKVAGDRAYDTIVSKVVAEVLPKSFTWLIGFQEKYVEGVQASAGKKAASDVVAAGRAGLDAGHRWACQRLDEASDAEIVEFHHQTDLSRPMFDAHELATRLLLVYEEALRQSGAFTVGEQLRRAREINGIEADVEKAEKDLAPRR